MYIFPPHLELLHYVAKQETRKCIFNLIAICCFANKHKTHSKDCSKDVFPNINRTQAAKIDLNFQSRPICQTRHVNLVQISSAVREIFHIQTSHSAKTEPYATQLTACGIHLLTAVHVLYLQNDR